MKTLIKKLIPKSLLALYHRALGEIAAIAYGQPSEKLIVVGVTGTKGKSSTVILTGRMLEAAGINVGWASTVSFKVGEREWLNATKMTMLGRFKLQELLYRMVRAGCTHAIVETSSEGIAQSRHRAINYDVVVLTNLTPEHIESHGGFENYKNAKLDLFRQLTRMRKKTINGARIDKTMVVNADDDHAKEFLALPADRKIEYHISDAHDISASAVGTTFTLHGENFKTHLIGNFNVYNSIAAATVAGLLGAPLDVCATALEKVAALPGRMEFIQRKPFAVIVDYAHEPASTRELYETVLLLKPTRIIQVFGSTGGGRDVSRRRTLGELAGRFCDMVIVTTDDPYDDRPAAIADAVAKGAEAAGKVRDKDLFIELDREQAIALAVKYAKPGDVVLVTGKGSEQAMVVAGGRKIPWDDREIVRKAL